MLSEEKIENKKQNKLAKKEKRKALWTDFKKFISKGNVIDMAVGVIIGGAFSAIVTSVVNILMSLCTWGLPGGIKGLVTPLPAANSAQAGITGIGQMFDSANIVSATEAYALSQGVTLAGPEDASFLQWQTKLLSLYTLHGTSYYYNNSNIIDWGTLINAIISFLIIAIVLFTIVKVVGKLNAQRELLKKKALEDYYTKHPEERPVPPDPAKPAPTAVELLTQIKVLLENQNSHPKDTKVEK